MNTYEIYIFKLIKEVEEKRRKLKEKRDDYTDKDYKELYNHYTAQKNILYRVLTGHNNDYSLNK